jgi:cell division protein FtsL
MLQRETMPSASSTAVELGETWRNSLKGPWEETLQGVLQLPTTGKGLFIYVMALALIAGALAIHVMLSVQIMDAQVQVTNMERQLAWIEQTNSEITYQIVQDTSMARMNRRAREQGYGYKVKRVYVDAMAGQSAAPASPQTNAAISAAMEANSIRGDENELPARLGGMGGDMLRQAQAAAMEGVDAAGEFAATQGKRASEFMGGQTERIQQRIEQWLGGAQSSE